MEVDVTNPEIAWMDAEHARLQAQARRMKKGLIDAATKNLERATSPFMREVYQRELEKARAMWPELDVA
jgi:hypothetical protein